ncbi:hypothetical protein Pan241w_00940 [Gimesia alba]|uniref:Uncharacterized protein n=1 Tax=Gimesia alba TaxID=2527973 RepID=A0A517R878_9PLAN|nr:maleylpyruvate isomerase N-terminal domain-containing protein [Gimesia alba]QDT40041.1 hypothetical protein Pan241w_00940 [Gimesia alba]
MSQSPIIATPLLEDVLDELHSLLRSLRPDEWHLPTVSSERLVRDIVAHLLDGSVRRLSMQRDRYTSPPPNGPNRGETLLDYLNRLNNSWEQATRRLSPNIIIDLLEVADRQYVEYFKSLDPFGQAFFPVAWAGEESSLNWFDVGREYTEKWHHTQQIFLATGRESTITGRRLYHPCLDLFLRALPYTFNDAIPTEGTSVVVEVTGAAGGRWQIVRTSDRWIASESSKTDPVVHVTIPQDCAWRVFTKRRTADELLAQFPQIKINGEDSLGRTVLEMVSVMA